MRAARWSVTLGQQRNGASVIGPVRQPVITFDSGVRIADDRGEPGLRPATLALNDRLGQVAQTTTPPGSTWAHLRVRGHLPSSQPSPRADDRQKSHAAIDSPVGVVVGRRLVASKVGVDCSLDTVRHGLQCPQSSNAQQHGTGLVTGRRRYSVDVMACPPTSFHVDLAGLRLCHRRAETDQERGSDATTRTGYAPSFKSRCGASRMCWDPKIFACVEAP